MKPLHPFSPSFPLLKALFVTGIFAAMGFCQNVNHNQQVMEAQKFPAELWRPSITPMQSEHPEITPKPPPPILSPDIGTESEFGARVHAINDRDPLTDISTIVDNNLYAPRVSRGEDGNYYLAGIVPADNVSYLVDHIEIYKNTGNPSATPWTPVTGIYAPGLDMELFDIEAVTSDDRCYIIYRIGTNAVECFWYQISNTSNHGFSTVASGAYPTYGSLTSDEVEYTGGVYLYPTWIADVSMDYSIKF